jgi:hypothetical protein
MTGLINRMVQRARGTLPGVEPLVRSRQTAAAALGSPIDENIVIAQTSRQASASIFSQVPSLVSRDRVEVADGRAGATADFPAPATLKNREIEANPSSPRDQLTEPHKVDPDLPRPAVASHEPLALEVHAAKQDRDDVEEPPAMVSPRSATLPELEPPRQRTDQPELRKTPAIPPSKPPAEPLAPLETATEHTEIYITIGSIELRAPQTEAPRKTTLFKPRVTLDDYLRRRSGAGS